MDLETVAGELFGRPLRLLLLIWIRQRGDPLFFITEASKETGYDHPHIVKELGMAVGLGLLTPLPTSRKNERKYYRREDSAALWQFVDLAIKLVNDGHLTDLGGRVRV